MADHTQKVQADKANKTAARTPAPASPDVMGPAQEPLVLNAGVQSPSAAIALQRSIGNQRASRLIQAKLTVGAAHDPLEQEADRVADQVVSHSFSPSIQRHHDEDEVMTKRDGMLGSFEAGGDFEQKLGSTGGGKSLDTQTRSQMEAGIGADFSNVRVHTGSQASSLNRSISALAFTRGSDVYFDHGQYNPGSVSGKHLIAHELTHVVQQGGAPQAG